MHGFRHRERYVPSMGILKALKDFFLAAHFNVVLDGKREILMEECIRPLTLDTKDLQDCGLLGVLSSSAEVPANIILNC